MTKEYKQWVKDALLLMGKQRELVGDVSVHLDFYVKYPKMCDIDNPVKTCLDLFKKRGWLKDDRQVTYLSVCKKQSEQERIEVEIKELDKQGNLINNQIMRLLTSQFNLFSQTFFVSFFMAKDYVKIARETRIEILKIIHKAQTSHIASCFSATDLAVVLYENADHTKDKIVWSN